MEFAFFALSLLLIVSALGVILFPNPIHSALFLIVHLLGVAGMFAFLEAHFLATMQIIVYAGAIMVLVMFVLMLLNLKRESIRKREIALLAGGTFLAVLLLAISWVQANVIFSEPLRYAPESVGTIEAVGRILFRDYVLPFEAASLLIIAAIVGAAMVAKTRRKVGTTQGGV